MTNEAAQLNTANLQDKLKDRESDNADLEQQLQDLTQSQTSDSEALKKSDSRLHELEEESEDLKAELETARNSLTVMEEEVASLLKRMENSATGTEQLQSQLKNEKASNEDAERALKKAELERDELRQKLDDAELASSELSKEIDEVFNENDQFKKDQESAIIEKEALQKQLDGTEEQQLQLTQELQTLNEELATAKAENAASEELLTQAAELEKENDALKDRNEEIKRKRDDVVNGLELATQEMTQLEKALAERDLDQRELRHQLDTANAKLEEALNDTSNSDALKTELQAAKDATEKSISEFSDLQKKLETAVEDRHSAEKDLVKAEAKIEADQGIRNEQSLRVKQLEDDLRRERDTVDRSAPAGALESLAGQMSDDRKHWEDENEAQRAELKDLRKRLTDAELLEGELSTQLESSQGNEKDANRAKALAGQRRSQIERMQKDVESARRQAKESEAYWKTEMAGFKNKLTEHLEAAERGDEDADKKLVKLMETLKVGVFDKYAKLRKSNNRLKKQHKDTKDTLSAVERILAKKQEEEDRLRKIVDRLESGIKKPAKKKT